VGVCRTTSPERRRRLGLSALCAAVLCLATLPGASADGDGDGDNVPSKERVRHAQERADSTADRVAAIKAELAAADQRLQSLTIEAGKAAEAYNGARYRLQQARDAVHRAQRAADAATADLHLLRHRVSAAVVANYEAGGTLAGLGVLINDPDPGALLRRLDAFQTVTGAVDSALDDLESATAAADRKRSRAEDALDERQQATEEAQEAKQAAETAVARAQAAVSRTAAEKDALVRRLARVQHVSVALARQRQEALAEQAAEEAAEQAQQEAEQAAQDSTTNQDSTDNQSSTDTQDSTASQDGASAAIAFAKEQLGEPYVWGAAGPDSWDCSGLTMEAWAAGGVSLSHWSVAQYYETTPVAFSDIQPGDLLFWSETDDPDTIYHVAMYLGDGMMIQAPQPGSNVEIVSIYYWILPNLYTRV
jgi:cell wall-associated NlpC family hydrolase